MSIVSSINKFTINGVAYYNTPNRFKDSDLLIADLEVEK